MAGGERVWLAAWLLAAALGAPPVSAGTEARTEAPRSAWLESLDRGLGRVLSPGDLAAAHAALGELSSCLDCHAGLDATPDARCLVCHEDVGRRMRDRAGWHGTFSGACASCHGEHRGAGADLLGLDREAFNHDLAGFSLRDAHVSVDCTACHEREGSDGRRAFHPIGIAHETCADCHGDVHGEAFLRARDCAACHTQRGFGAPQLAVAGGSGRLVFDHGADADFPLAGRHAAVACGDCHDDASRDRERAEHLAPGRGAASACASCHRDPHDGALGETCAVCHSAEGWSGTPLRFDHARDTSFPLDATHAALACASCHADLRFAARATSCEGCHEADSALLAGRFGAHPPGAPDPHEGPSACASCHSPREARARLVDYEPACRACHPAEYGALLLTRRRLLDGLVVEAGARLRAAQLARARGDAGDARDFGVLASEIDALARSGIHNLPLAEAILRELAGEAER
jgi:hypothetical protein